MLMRGYQIGPIALGQKTVTCRRWKARRMVPGRLYQLKTHWLKSAWATIRAKTVDQQRWVGDVVAGDWWGHDEIPVGAAPSAWVFAAWIRMASSVRIDRSIGPPNPPDQPVFGIHDALQDEGRAEGFDSWESFLYTWRDMHGQAAVAEPCWRISFSVEEMLVEPILYGFAMAHPQDPWPQGHPLCVGDRIVCCADLATLKQWRADLPYDIVRFEEPIAPEQILWWHHWIQGGTGEPGERMVRRHPSAHHPLPDNKPLDHPPAVSVIEAAPKRRAGHEA